MSETNELVPIRTVCATLGLNPRTLRTWERRHAIIEPLRGPGGQRAYQTSDVKILEEMVRMTKGGMAPALAAHLILRTSRSKPTPSSGASAALRERLHSAIVELDYPAALHTVHVAHEQFGYTGCVEGVLFPVLRDRGECWQENPQGIAYEHVVSLAAKAYLLDRHRRLLPKCAGPTVTLACAPGEEHEFPLIHLANRLSEGKKVRPLLLVGGLPLDQVTASAKQSNSELLILSASIPPKAEHLRSWAETLREQGWEERTLLAGGGFSRSRIFSSYRVRPTPLDFSQAVSQIEESVLTDSGV